MSVSGVAVMQKRADLSSHDQAVVRTPGEDDKLLAAPDAQEGAAKTRRVVDRVSSLVSASTKNRSHIATLRRRIEQLECDNVRLEIELTASLLREAASAHDACHDALTGLPNRTLMRDRFQQATARSDRLGSQVAVLFLDLDQFKHVNDRFGHAIGDRVLQMVARRIQESVRTTDTASRHGGDEFVIMLTDLDDARVAGDIVDKIQLQLTKPCRFDEGVIALRCTIGVAVYPVDGVVWETLVAHADAAMYRTKPKTPE